MKTLRNNWPFICFMGFILWLIGQHNSPLRIFGVFCFIAGVAIPFMQKSVWVNDRGGPTWILFAALVVILILSTNASNRTVVPYHGIGIVTQLDIIALLVLFVWNSIAKRSR